MSTQQQTAQQGATQTQEKPGDFARLIKADHKTTEYVPYGSPDAIVLTVEIVHKYLCKPTASGKLCSAADAMKFILMCRAKRLNPFEGDAFLVGYDNSKAGSPDYSIITAHQSFLKRAELHAEYDGMESGVVVLRDGQLVDIDGECIVVDEVLFGGWARVSFKTRRIPTYRRLMLRRFAKDNKFWNGNPEGMIVKCAEADGLRSSFPTMLGGMYLAEEIQIDVSPSRKSGEDNTKENSKLVQFKQSDPEPAQRPASEEQAEAAAGLAPEFPEFKPDPKRDAAPQVGPTLADWQAELAEVVESSGCDWPLFVRWCGESGSLADADSFAGFHEVKKADCEKLLRSFRGAKSRPIILEQLEKLKGRLV